MGIPVGYDWFFQTGIGIINVHFDVGPYTKRFEKEELYSESGNIENAGWMRDRLKFDGGYHRDIISGTSYVGISF